MTAPLIIPWKGILPRISAEAFIAPNATLIGDIEIGDRSSIWFNVVLRADVSSIRIGKSSNLQDGTIVHVSSQGGRGGTPTVVGDDVLVGHAAILHACTLGNGSFVGMGAIVLDGAVVESQAMVAAGALVGPGKRIPSGELWAGNPARFMRKLSEGELKHFKHATDQYADVGDVYRGYFRDRQPGS